MLLVNYTIFLKSPPTIEMNSIRSPIQGRKLLNSSSTSTNTERIHARNINPKRGVNASLKNVPKSRSNPIQN